MKIDANTFDGGGSINTGKLKNEQLISHITKIVVAINIPLIIVTFVKLILY